MARRILHEQLSSLSVKGGDKILQPRDLGNDVEIPRNSDDVLLISFASSLCTGSPHQYGELLR